ncbi:hypothetical protein N7519_004033, partial [Penicillium mononematosum]|uniref:uncharacterized protein n=1 Tax=Penicillium mononematosum TaxID=268346 RepID=UPI0025491F90
MAARICDLVQNVGNLVFGVNLRKSDIPVDGVTVARVMGARRVFSCIGMAKWEGQIQDTVGLN